MENDMVELTTAINRMIISMDSLGTKMDGLSFTIQNRIKEERD